MKITIRHNQSTIDPNATVSDADFPRVKASLEAAYTVAIQSEYPGAEVQFEDSDDFRCLVVEDADDDYIDIEHDVQRTLEIVYDTGLFWI
jgi:hypothetical protein